MMKGTRWPLVLMLGLVVVVMSACGGNRQQTQSGAEDQHHGSSDSSEGLRGEDLDRAFIKGMVPHHAAAVEMARMERDKGTRAEVKDLAQSIIDAQEREIVEMSDIAKEKYGFTPERQHNGPMGTFMGVPISMDMAAMHQKMADAADTDAAFLMMMRPHHAGAIVMADEEMRNGADTQLKGIAEMIVADQAKELGRIQQLLDATDGPSEK